MRTTQFYHHLFEKEEAHVGVPKLLIVFFILTLLVLRVWLSPNRLMAWIRSQEG